MLLSLHKQIIFVLLLSSLLFLNKNLYFKIGFRHFWSA